jgi:hypothetical protein
MMIQRQTIDQQTTEQEDIEERTTWADAATHTHAPTEPIVRVPEAGHTRGRRLTASIAPWMIFFAVGMIVVITLFALVLTRDPSGEGTPPTAEGQSSINATPNEPELETFRTQTVNVDRGQDVMAMVANPSSLVPLFGAPITADGVIVSEVFGPEAFTVTSPSGAEMLVYVAKQGEPEFVAVTPGQKITFLGTLMPVRDDFDFLVGPAAAPVAQSTGAYLYAVPQTIRVITVQET